MNHQANQATPAKVRMHNTFTSQIFGQGESKTVNHKTNLGHRKDHSTKEIFGDDKIEPLRKQK
jgi:hypothetical protein